jgi:uncharacterized protein (TIGR02147 family)
MNLDSLKSPSHWIAAELGHRKSNNSRYSLRTLSATVGISPGRLSELIAGKRRMTLKQAERIADRLGYAPATRLRLFKAVAGQTGIRKTKASQSTKAVFTAVSADSFQIIADWQHFAILSLMDTKTFRNDSAWIARRLGISKSLVEISIDRLCRVGVLKRIGEQLVKTGKNHETTHDISSPALRISHRQTLMQAADSLDSVPVDLRDITSMTMAIDPSKIPKAKKLIRQFRHRLCEMLEADEKSEVFNLNIQLVPVTNFEPEGEAHDK